MRITQNVKNSQLMINLNKVSSERQKYFNQMSTGKKIEISSDDPTGTAKVLQLNKLLTQASTYQKNIDDSKSFLTATEASLNAVTDNLEEALTIGLKGASDTTGQDARKILATQLDFILQRVVAESNRQYGNKYIFGGTAIDKNPFEINSDKTAVEMTNNTAINGSIKREILKGDQLEINFSGKDVFVDTKLFETLIDIRDALNNNDAEAVQEAYMSLKTVNEEITNFTSIVGLKYDHVSSVENTLVEFDFQMKALKSSIEDADYAEAAINFEAVNSVYQANLQFGAKILNMSLMDYLG